MNSEISNELKNLGTDKLPEVDMLVIGKFDSGVYKKTSHFLLVLKKYYSTQLAKASEAKETMVTKLTSSQEALTAFDQMRLDYQNEAVTQMVENSNDAIRIVEWKEELVQKIYPIYFDDHRPKHAWDFRGNFYIPTKYFFGNLDRKIIVNII